MGKVPLEKRSPLARNIVLRRTALKWSQPELAHKAGFHPNVIKKIENDRGDGDPETREAIAGALGCSLSELYDIGSDPRNVAFAVELLSKFDELLPVRRAAVLYLLFRDKKYLKALSEDRLQAVLSLVKAL